MFGSTCSTHTSSCSDEDEAALEDVGHLLGLALEREQLRVVLVEAALVRHEVAHDHVPLVHVDLDPLLR